MATQTRRSEALLNFGPVPLEDYSLLLVACLTVPPQVKTKAFHSRAITVGSDLISSHLQNSCLNRVTVNGLKCGTEVQIVLACSLHFVQLYTSNQLYFRATVWQSGAGSAFVIAQILGHRVRRAAAFKSDDWRRWNFQGWKRTVHVPETPKVSHVINESVFFSHVNIACCTIKNSPNSAESSDIGNYLFLDLRICPQLQVALSYSLWLSLGAQTWRGWEPHCWRASSLSRCKIWEGGNLNFGPIKSLVWPKHVMHV